MTRAKSGIVWRTGILRLRKSGTVSRNVAQREVRSKDAHGESQISSCASRLKCYAIRVAHPSARILDSDVRGIASRDSHSVFGAGVGRSVRANPGVDPAELAARELSLAQRVREGDEAAFEQIFRAYYARLVSFACTKLGSQALAEEMVQEVFLQIWTRRGQWVVERSLAAYVFRAVRNRVLNARRSIRLEVAYAATAACEMEIETSEPCDGRLRDAEIGAALAHALALLPERPRQVFLLSRRQGLSYAEIADVLGIAVKTVEMHMGRALAQLRVSLHEWRHP